MNPQELKDLRLKRDRATEALRDTNASLDIFGSRKAELEGKLAAADEDLASISPRRSLAAERLAAAETARSEHFESVTKLHRKAGHASQGANRAAIDEPDPEGESFRRKLGAVMRQAATDYSITLTPALEEIIDACAEEARDLLLSELDSESKRAGAEHVAASEKLDLVEKEAADASIALEVIDVEIRAKSEKAASIREELRKTTDAHETASIQKGAIEKLLAEIEPALAKLEATSADMANRTAANEERRRAEAEKKRKEADDARKAAEEAKKKPPTQ